MAILQGAIPDDTPVCCFSSREKERKRKRDIAPLNVTCGLEYWSCLKRENYLYHAMSVPWASSGIEVQTEESASKLPRERPCFDRYYKIMRGFWVDWINNWRALPAKALVGQRNFINMLHCQCLSLVASWQTERPGQPRGTHVWCSSPNTLVVTEI